MKVTIPWIAASTFLVCFLLLSWLPVSVGQQGEAPLPTREKMIWVSASNSTALCNDFTRAGFFIRRNTSSNNWVVFLEGGGLCYNTDTCNRRFFVSMVSAYKRLSEKMHNTYNIIWSGGHVLPWLCCIHCHYVWLYVEVFIKRVCIHIHHFFRLLHDHQHSHQNI